MNWLREGRERLHLSQRQLARKAGVAYKTLQLIENGRHDPRWSTLAKLDKALSRAPTSLDTVLRRRFGSGADTAAEAALRMIEDGEASWKLWLMEFADAFHRRPRAESVAEAPSHRLSPGLRALLASAVEFLCAEKDIPIPWWCAGVPSLSDPWFLSESENLKATALVESPSQFRRRNIFVLSNFLSRV